MALTDYAKTISTDFPNGKVDSSRLTQEIQQSPIVTALDRIDTGGDTCNIWFKAALSLGDATLLDGLVAVHSGLPLAPSPVVAELTSPTNAKDKILLVANAPREGDEVIYATHNLCDRTTWYSQSARSEAEALTDSGDGLTWNSGHTNWINLFCGKVMDEDGLRAEVPHGYAITVTVDGVEKTPRECYETTGGDYTVDFVTGSVTFFASQTGKAVLASYSYENGQTWIFGPTTGKVLDVESVEAQFSADVVLNDTLKFSLMGYAAVFAPDAVAGGFLQPTDLVELGSDRYKRITQLIDQALGAFPSIPPIGGPIQGTQNPVYGFPFRYGTMRRLFSTYGMQLHVTLEHGRPMGGEYATATFYCVSRTEAGLL